MGCSMLQMVTVFTTVILILALILPFFLAGIVNADIQQAETDTFFLDQQNELLNDQDDLQQLQNQKLSEKIDFRTERWELNRELTDYQRDIGPLVRQGEVEQDYYQEEIESKKRIIKDMQEQTKLSSIKAEHYGLIKDYTIMTEWNQETFEYWTQANDQTGVSLYETAFGAEQTEYVERLLNVDFSNPGSYDQVEVEQRTLDQLERLRDHEEDHNIANRWDPENPKNHIPKTSYNGRISRIIDAKIESDWTPVTKESYINYSNTAAKVGAGVVMGVTSLSAINIGAMLWRNSKDGDNGNGKLMLMVIAIIALACVFGVLGLTAENQNRHFVNITQYAMLSFCGAMLIAQGLCAYNTDAFPVFGSCCGDNQKDEPSASDESSKYGWEYTSTSSDDDTSSGESNSQYTKSTNMSDDTADKLRRNQSICSDDTADKLRRNQSICSKTHGINTRRLLARLNAATSA